MAEKTQKLKYNQIVGESGMLSSLTQIANMRFEGADFQFLLDISKNSVELSQHAETWQKTRESLLHSYGERDENDKPIVKDMQMQISDENFVKFNEEINKLMETEVEVTLNTLSEDNLKRSKDLTPNIIKGLLPIIE